MNKIRISVLTLVMIGALGASTNGYAWNAASTIRRIESLNLPAWAQNLAEKLATMTANQSAKLVSLGALVTSSLASANNTGQHVAATIEKQNGLYKELSQSELNYRANVVTAEGAAEADDKFDTGTELTNMCKASAIGVHLAKTAASGALNGKAQSAALVRGALGVRSHAVAQHEIMMEHADKYCSRIDVLRGRCDKTDIPIEFQNADSQAGSLLSPSNGTTYSERESDAAVDFIRMTLNTSVPENLPLNLERQPSSQAYLAFQRSTAALMAFSYYSMSQIWAAREPDPALSTSTSAPGEALSMHGILKKFVNDPFVSKAWRESLNGKNEVNSTLREIAVVLSGKSFLSYQSFLQHQRMEAAYAAHLALVAGLSSADRLEQARSLNTRLK
jgi:hypothetical protein